MRAQSASRTNESQLRFNVVLAMSGATTLPRALLASQALAQRAQPTLARIIPGISLDFSALERQRVSSDIHARESEPSTSGRSSSNLRGPWSRLRSPSLGSRASSIRRRALRMLAGAADAHPWTCSMGQHSSLINSSGTGAWPLGRSSHYSTSRPPNNTASDAGSSAAATASCDMDDIPGVGRLLPALSQLVVPSHSVH